MSEPPLHVTCIVPYPLDTVPGQRFRWEQWARYLERDNIQVTFIPFASAALDKARRTNRKASALVQTVSRVPPWLLEIQASAQTDVFVIQRSATIGGPPFVEWSLARFGRPIIYDFDDAIHLPPDGPDSALRRLFRCDWKVPVLCRQADLVSVGNPLLAEYARWFSNQVVVWPTTIDTESVTPRAPEAPARNPVIGWSGSHSTARYLEELLPTLGELARQRPFEMLVVGAQVDLEAWGITGECLPWQADQETARFHRMDMGVMPLPDTPWSRGKCALKALQYLAAGVPAVVSDVGVNAQAVPSGKVGIVIKDPTEWIPALTKLLDDVELRRGMGRAGRTWVEEQYSAAAWSPVIGRRLRELAKKPEAQALPEATAPTTA